MTNATTDDTRATSLLRTKPRTSVIGERGLVARPATAISGESATSIATM
jgi:hypothetical protein